MAKGAAPSVSFNAGEIGNEIISRTGLENYGATASILENIFPEAAGPMSKRPGLGFKVELGVETYLRKWVYGIDQKYLLAFSDNTLRIIQDGGVIARPAVTCSITNDDFDSPIGTGWTDVSDTTGLAATSGGLLRLASDGTQRAAARQEVTTSSPGVLHALVIEVRDGPAYLRVGSTAGGVEYIRDIAIRKGWHTIAFIPSGTFYVEIYNTNDRLSYIRSCKIAPAGDLTLPTPWLASDFTSLRFQQSRDVVYAAGVEGVHHKRIERHGVNSWSLVDTDEQDGPFLGPNVDTSLMLKPSAMTGNGILTANRPFFTPSHVGALFKITLNGQRHLKTIGGPNQYTDAVKVTGSGSTTRVISWVVSGTWAGTVSMFESLDGVSWSPMSTGWTGSQTTTANGSFSFADFQDGNKTRASVPWYYRLGIGPNDYTSGYARCRISTDNGAQVGIVRVTSYLSETQVNYEVLRELSGTDYTAEWEEGAWSGQQGFPRALALFDDRLWTGYLDSYWASQSSLYEVQSTGDKDADAIWRSISTGEVGKIQWILPLSRVVIGTDAAEDVVRSSAFDDPITPTNITVRDISSWGSADVEPEKVDARGLFIDRSTIHAMEIAYATDVQDYVAKPLTRLHKNIGRPGLSQICVSRRPETRLYIIRKDGQVLTKIYDPQENVLGWSRMVTPGRNAKIISVESLPGSIGSGEDENYFVVKRRIQGVYRYYLEQLSNIHNETAADANCVDSYIRIDQDPVQSVIFNGATYLQRASTLSGVSDGKAGTISFWVNLTDRDEAEQFVYRSQDGYFTVRRTADGKWEVEGKNASGTTILKITSGNSYSVESGWTHVAFAWNLASGIAKFYISRRDADAETGNGSIITNDTIDYTRSSHYIGGTNPNWLSAELSQVYINLAEYIDIGVTATRQKFISVHKSPVDIGSDGSVPSGTAPALYFANNADTFQTNLGTGGTFTIGAGFFSDTEPPAPRLVARSKVISGLDHLEGETVAVWADGYDVGDYLVTGGQITLLVQPAQVSVGLNYLGRYKSSRIALQDSDQTQLAQPMHISFILLRSTRRVRFGQDFTSMDDLNSFDLAVFEVEDDGVLQTGISESLSVPGDKNRDPRLCIEMPRPDPVTLAGYVLGQDVNQAA